MSSRKIRPEGLSYVTQDFSPEGCDNFWYNFLSCQDLPGRQDLPGEKECMMFNKKEQKALLFLIFLIIAGALIILLRDYRTGDSFEIIKGKQSVEVYVYGEVVYPGVYKVAISDSIGRLLEKAGISKSASRKAILSILDSNSIVHMPVNINTANKKELESLPGIGPKLAQNIIDYRSKYGNFKNKEEIKKIKGIGIKKFQTLSCLIFTTEKKSGEVPGELEIETRGFKKESVYKVRSGTTISDFLNLAGGPVKETNLKFLKLEIK